MLVYRVFLYVFVIVFVFTVVLVFVYDQIGFVRFPFEGESGVSSSYRKRMSIGALLFREVNTAEQLGGRLQ